VLEAVAILAAGLAAGTINTIVGSGTLITFPVLLAFGYSPVVANVSNTVGLTAGTVSGSVGYRHELRGQRQRIVRLGAASMVGSLTGAILLIVLPGSAFKAIVPGFIAAALVLVFVQPKLAGLLVARRAESVRARPGPAAIVAVYACGIYGGYFGAAQGVLVLAVLGIAIHDGLQRLNGLKNALTTLVNIVAAIVFVAVAHVAWTPALLIAAGSIAGGQLGAHVGRRLPEGLLRVVIVAVGVAAMVKLLAG
jgi:uncharacterized membrane protein YfcA